MKKNRPKQQKRNIGKTVTCIVMLLIGLLFLFEAVQDLVMLSKWDSGGVLAYQGSYSVSKIKYPRNTNYLFTLENGDAVQVPDEYLENDDLAMAEPQLAFRYSAHKGIFNRWTHSAVSITSTDGERVFVQEESSKSVARGTVITYSILGVPWILIVVLLNIKVSWYIRCIRFLKGRKQENRT